MDILLIEDDQDTAGFISAALQEAGHNIQHADNGRDGLFMAASTPFSMIILDRQLPGGIDGLRILETLRNQENTTPVLFLSGLGQVNDKVSGFKSGGNDYLAKPFEISELLARIEALDRRHHVKPAETELKVGDLYLNLLSRQGTRGTRKIDLQPREFRLLECLMRNAGQTVSRAEILQSVWAYNFDPQTNLVEVHISRLRRKLEVNFEAPVLHTVRNTGYILRPAEDSGQAARLATSSGAMRTKAS